jgi:phosphate transport system ATP-binding protein
MDVPRNRFKRASTRIMKEEMMQLAAKATDSAFPTMLSGDISREAEQAHSLPTGRKTVGTPFTENPRMTCRDVEVFYGDKMAINKISIDVGCDEVLVMIGPSGCGKSTFLLCLNRMNDTVASCRTTGQIRLDDIDIYHPSYSWAD